MTSISLSVIDGILWRLDGNCFLKMVLTQEVLWRMATLSSLSAKRWRQRGTSELDVHLVHSVWNMSSPCISYISSSWHPYCFKSYSIHLKNQTFHLLALLKLGGIFQKIKNGHRVGHRILSFIHGDFSATAAWGLLEDYWRMVWQM